MGQHRQPRNKPSHVWSVASDKSMQWDNNSFSKKWWWDNRVFHKQRVKLDLYLTPNANMNSKRIKDLNIEDKTLRRKRSGKAS